MPDLKDRRKYEDELATALLLAWERNGKAWPALEVSIRAALEKTLAKSFAEAAREMAIVVMLLAKDSVAVETIADGAEKWASDRAKDLAKDIVSTTKDVGELDKERAEMIAVTEVTGSVSAGEDAAAVWFAADGGEYRPKWYTEDDAKVCEICGPLHGKGVEIYRRVNPDGPPAHPNCRCWLEYEKEK